MYGGVTCEGMICEGVLLVDWRGREGVRVWV